MDSLFFVILKGEIRMGNLFYLGSLLGFNNIQTILVISAVVVSMSLNISQKPNRNDPIEPWEIRDWLNKK